MPKFTIRQVIHERFEVDAEDAQTALELFLSAGRDNPHVKDLTCSGVDERWVEDEDGNYCETEES